VSVLPRWSGRPGKVSLAIRRMIAARRKTLRQYTPTVVTEFKDRLKFIYIPVDVATGRIIDPDRATTHER
jgi:hypothetical protein